MVQTQNWFLKAVPEPTPKNINTQLGVHIEEVVEMLSELIARTPEHHQKLVKAMGALTVLSDAMKEGNNYDVLPEQRIGLLDALCDQIVTATGVGTFLGMNVPGAMDEVNRSNYSKFVDGQPIFDENRKVKKGPNYTKPVLIPFV